MRVGKLYRRCIVRLQTCGLLQASPKISLFRECKFVKAKHGTLDALNNSESRGCL